MKQKLLIMGAFALGFLSITTINVSALNDSKIYDGVSGAELRQTLCQSKEGNVTFPNSVKAGTKDIELYCVYSNKDEVLNEINEKFYDTIQFVKQNYNIQENLNSDNWQEYRKAMINVSVDFPNVDSKILYSIAEIDGNFDIYENDEINNQIEKLAVRYNIAEKARGNEQNIIMEEIDSIIPNYSDNFGTIEKRIQPRVGSTLNVARATDYAIRYATSPNKSAYHYFNNGDCTNFTSQILEYSGVQQDVYDSEYSGWWHKTVTTLGIITSHKHSRSWTMADTFARYMGVTVKTTSIKNWAEGLYEGDFIALDKTNDGSWDHMAYVTERGTPDTAMADDPINKVCISFRDIKIAQHTSNYHEWISSSKNGWETYYTRASYGRVRG